MCLMQVMINVFFMCTVFGEPLSQTAQSFMPELMHGVNRSLEKVQKSDASIVFSCKIYSVLMVIHVAFHYMFYI